MYGFRLLALLFVACLALLTTAGLDDERDPERRLNLQQESRHTPIYRARLLAAYRVLLAFMATTATHPAALWKTKTAARILVDFVQHMYTIRGTFSVAKHAVLASQTKFRGHKGHLRVAWDSIQASN